MLSAAVCDAWRTVGSPSNRLRRAKCLKADSSTAIPPAPHLSVPRSLPYTSVQTRTFPCRRRRGGSWRTQTENFGEGDSRAGVRRRIEWQQVGRHQSRDQVSSTQKNHQRASFLENANEPFGENLCVGLRASKSLCPPRFRWGQKDPSLTHILVRESLLWWKHWRWWCSALKNLHQTLSNVWSNQGWHN